MGKIGNQVMYPRRRKIGMFSLQIEFEFETESLIVDKVIMAQALCGFLLLLSTYSIQLTVFISFRSITSSISMLSLIHFKKAVILKGADQRI